MRFGVLRGAGKVNQNAALVTDDPFVMPRRNKERVTGTVLHLRAVIHLNHYAAGEHKAGVSRLTGIRAGGSLKLFAPTPSWFVLAMCHDGGTDHNHFQVSLPGTISAALLRQVADLMERHGAVRVVTIT